MVREADTTTRGDGFEDPFCIRDMKCFSHSYFYFNDADHELFDFNFLNSNSKILNCYLYH